MMKLFKFVAAFLSAFTICFSPLAEALAKTESQKEKVNEFLKGVGITTKKMTVSEYWRQVRHVYPHNLQKKMDLFVAKHRDDMMPTVDATSFKDAEGRDQVRLALNQGGEALNVTIIGDDTNFIKINNVVFSKNEAVDPEVMAQKLLKNDSKLNKKVMTSADLPILRKQVVMNYDELKKLTVLQRAEYFVRLRDTMMAAQKIYKTVYGQAALDEYNKKFEKYAWVQAFLLGEDAQAKTSPLSGKECVVAGYLSIYGENGSCGGNSSGAQDLQAQMNSYQATCSAPNQVPCNPLVYGFKAGSTAFCVARTPSVIIDATANCNKQSPFNGSSDIANKKRIIESFINRSGKKIDLKFDEEGKVSPEQLAQVNEYLTGLNGLIKNAGALCEGPEFKAIKEQRPDQGKACSALLTRAFDLQAFAACPVPAPAEPIPEPVPVGECGEKPGSTPAADGSCVCREGTLERTDEKGVASCEVVVVRQPADRGAPPPKIQDECGFFCKNKGLLIGVGVIALAGGLAWWLLKDDGGKKKKPVYTCPAPCPDTPPICDSPFVLVNGVCQAPPVVVDPPVVVVGPETGTVVDGRSGGGVRKATGSQ